MSHKAQVPIETRTSDEALIQRAKEIAPQFRALADENRLSLVLLLSERPRTVREMTDATGLSQTLVSHHLAPLRELGLVSVTPKGRSNIYSLCCDAFTEPLRTLAGITVDETDSTSIKPT